MLNVIITSNSRSAVSEIFGFVSRAHEHYFKEPIKISYEKHSAFEATRKRLPLLKGWNSIHDADPQLLLEKGYDKIIHITRPFLNLCSSLALYHRKANSVRRIIKLILKR